MRSVLQKKFAQHFLWKRGYVLTDFLQCAAMQYSIYVRPSVSPFTAITEIILRLLVISV